MEKTPRLIIAKLGVVIGKSDLKGVEDKTTYLRTKIASRPSISDQRLQSDSSLETFAYSVKQ